MSIEIDFLPIHNNSGQEFSICEERATKRPKVEEEIDVHHLGTTASIDQIEIKDSCAPASTTCASCLCDDCANFDVTFSSNYNNDEIELLRKVATHEVLHHKTLHVVLNLNHTSMRESPVLMI